MLLRTKLHGKTYQFPDVRTLMGKANEQKPGDELAGIGAESAAERVAARLALAEVPMWALRENPAEPYEHDEITRIIQYAVDETIYLGIKHKTVGEFHEWLLSDTTTTEMIHRVSGGLTAEMVAAVTRLGSAHAGGPRVRFRQTLSPVSGQLGCRFYWPRIFIRCAPDSAGRAGRSLHGQTDRSPNGCRRMLYQPCPRRPE